MKPKISLIYIVVSAAFGGVVGLSGCGGGDLDVRTYEVAKTAPIQAPTAVATGGPGAGNDNAPTVPQALSSGNIRWSVPPGWQVREASAMRAASFSVAGKGDASIVVLGGEAGGMAANVNRWRGQIGLEPLGEPEIQREARLVKGVNGEFHWFKLLGSSDSILAGIVARPDRSIFVKLTASRQVLEQNQEKFLNLCKSIKVQQ